MSTLLRVAPHLVTTLYTLSLLACSCDDGTGGDGTSDAGMSDAQTDGATADGSKDAGPDAALGECSENEDCEDGLCFADSTGAGLCCESAELLCGDECCEGESLCFAGSCVVPGDTCRLDRDCGDESYCEYALGTPPPDDNACSTLAQGKCLALPLDCNQSGAGDNCIAPAGTCEFRPEVGPLNAVVQWEWNDANATLPEAVDVWNTPMVGRVADTDCDGDVDRDDVPAIVFISGTVLGDENNRESGEACQIVGTCKKGVLRALAGDDGRELLTLPNIEDSQGFTAMSLALADMNRDGVLDIVAMTGERHLAVIDGQGQLLMKTSIVASGDDSLYGVGAGISVADIDQDGFAEVAFAGKVFTSKSGNLEHMWTASYPVNLHQNLDFFADVHASPGLELVTANALFSSAGAELWAKTGIGTGFPAIADLDNNGTPEIVSVAQGWVYVFDSAGNEVFPRFPLGNNGGAGGPPTLADFDGDGAVEIGVAQKNNYFMIKPNFTDMRLDEVWAAPNHDLSSSVTGSTVFDFEGDGAAEVIYNDECFLWVYDGKSGDVRFATPTKSFTQTESNVVADVDADGHAEMLWIANQVKDSSNGNWNCSDNGWTEPDPETGRPAWSRPTAGEFWRGLRVYRDAANSWVGTRQIWNQHAYSVTNICTGEDSACAAGTRYGEVPAVQIKNWEQPWANNFRQNIQESGVFDAADAVVDLKIRCNDSAAVVTLRNRGRAPLPAGVEVEIYADNGGNPQRITSVTSEMLILPGRSAELTAPVSPQMNESYFARIVSAGTFTECDDANNQSEARMPSGCLR